MLSGFVIATSWLRESEQTGSVDLGLFLVRRMYRLVPALVVFLACMSALSLLDAIDVSAGALLAPLVFARNLYPGEWTTGHLWSLGLQEQFPLVAAGLVAFGGLRGWLIGCVGLAVLCPWVRVVSWLGTAWGKLPEAIVPTLGAALAHGCLAAYVHHVRGHRLDP